MTSLPADADHFFLQTTRRKDKAVVTLQGDVDVSIAHRLTQTLSHVAGPDGGEIVVDLSDAKLVDSAALGALVLAQKQARRRGGDLVLTGVRDETRHMLHVTGLDRVFRLAPGD